MNLITSSSSIFTRLNGICARRPVRGEPPSSGPSLPSQSTCLAKAATRDQLARRRRVTQRAASWMEYQSILIAVLGSVAAKPVEEAAIVERLNGVCARRPVRGEPPSSGPSLPSQSTCLNKARHRASIFLMMKLISLHFELVHHVTVANQFTVVVDSFSQ